MIDTNKAITEIHPGTEYPGEGYAVLQCGNVRVILGYTLLHHLRFKLESQCPVWGQIATADKALESIRNEAAEGKCG